MMKKMFRDHDLENGIAEKLQPLIVKMMALRFVTETGMRERFRQQKRIAKLVVDAFFERTHPCDNLANDNDFVMSRVPPEFLTPLINFE